MDDRNTSTVKALQAQMKAIRDLLFKAEKQLIELGGNCFDIQEGDSCTEYQYYAVERARRYINAVEEHLTLAVNVSDNLNALSINAVDGIPIARMDREQGNGTDPCERDANARLFESH